MSKLPTSRLPVTPSKSATASKPGLRPPQQSSSSAAAAAATSQQTSPNAGDAAASTFALGDRVTANGKSGTVAFIGSTKFAEGEWIGVVLDEAQGKNDGSYEGTRYFETETNRGLFCRPAKVQRLAQNGAGESSGEAAKPLPDASKTPSATPNVEKADAADTTIVNATAAETPAASNTQQASTEPPSAELRVGDRVVVSGTKFGTLKYLGKIHVAEGVWCGIQLDEPLGKNDGSVSGKRYFTCQQRYGLFSPLARVEKVTGDVTQAQLNARKASISSSTNNNRPLHRSNSQESLQSNLSEFSTSSNSISRIPTRTPGRPQQPKVTASSNVYSTPNTKSLLTQAAATLAAVTPSSNQVANLVQTIKDKDIFIEKLQSQREQDRLEFSRAAQQVDEMESRMLAFKQQYDVKEVENEQLKKEQYQTKQRIEDLEFQLEEYKLTDSNKEQAGTSTIPEGHRLLGPKDVEIYEQIKEKVLELETVNQKLVLEKQTLQDEHRHELKRQSETNENDFKSRFQELQQKYDDVLKSRDGNEAIKSEYESKLNEKDRQIQEATEKITNEKQQEIDQLKAQITELQNKEQSSTASLTERQSLYEQQQSKLEQSMADLQELQSQLAAVQQGKEATDKQIQELLSELNGHRENTIPQLEQQCQTLKTELENRERLASSAAGERESHYEQQIKDYQSNLAQASAESDRLRNELKQFQDEATAKDKQSTDALQSLQQELEKLHAQLHDREHQATTTLSERESHFDAQIKDLQNQITQFTQRIGTLQSELTKSHEEKASVEKTLNETINTLKQDHERQYEQLKVELTALQDRDRTQNMALNEREVHYEEQIKEHQTKRDQAVREAHDLRSDLTKLQEEKATNEKTFDASKQDLEKQIHSLTAQITELENQARAQVTATGEKEQQLKDLHARVEQVNQENAQLHEQIEQRQREHESKLAQLQQELEQKRQTHDESMQHSEQLTKVHEQLKNAHETLKKELEDLQTKHHELQSECQKQSSSNEQLRNTNDNVVNEKQATIDQLTKQLADMQQVQAELIEKQVKQHADLERQRAEDKSAQEKLLKEKAEEYENEIVLLKSQFRVESENSKLDYEQEKLRLKTQLQQALQASPESKTSTVTGSQVKQLEYELTDARYQIEKLQKQLDTNASKDDRSSLESQVNFLNDVIVELRNTNERLKQELEFQKNPFAGDDHLAQSATGHVKSSAPRLYCDMCEVFDQHDTDDCPKQSSMADEQAHGDGQIRERVLPPPRLYCEKCEEFGHDCNDADETY